MKRGGGSGPDVEQAGSLERSPREGPGEDAVVGAEKLLLAELGPEQPPGRAHAGIDHHDVQRAGGKGRAGLADEPGGGADVVRGHVVRDIDERERRAGVQEPPLHLGDVAGAGAEVGGERDDTGHGGTRERRESLLAAGTQVPNLSHHGPTIRDTLCYDEKGPQGDRVRG